MLVAAMCLASGCASDASSDHGRDADRLDGSLARDSARIDVGRLDAAVSDAISFDGGGFDAEFPLDAGRSDIGRMVDVGTSDASLPDAGSSPVDIRALSVADWHDYLVQDTCRAGGRAVSGDPLRCAEHSDLRPDERVHFSFKYSDSARNFAIASLPRRGPAGDTAMVLFDAGGNHSGRGLFDLDDPHCKVPGSLCFHTGDVDIVDLVEAHVDSSWDNVVSAMGTAHIGTGGYLGFGTSALGASGFDWPDGWLFGVAGDAPTSPIDIDVVVDATGGVRTYPEALVWDKAICSAALGGSAPSCSALGYNQWLLVERMYVGAGKTFENVIVSVHSSSPTDIQSCAGHMELYLHSREYGLMSHQTWKHTSCPGDAANIGCIESEAAMVRSPMTYHIAGQPLQMRRTACTRAISNGAEYVFDPRALSQPSEPVPYPSAPVVDAVGYGNVLLNGQFAWPDTVHAGWSTFAATASERSMTASDPAPHNDAVEVRCSAGCSGSSIYQDVELPQRAPSLIGEAVAFGARVAVATASPPGTGSVVVFALSSGGTVLDTLSSTFTADQTWPSATGTFVNATGRLPPGTATIRFQLYVDNPAATYIVDDLFVVRDS